MQQAEADSGFRGRCEQTQRGSLRPDYAFAWPLNLTNAAWAGLLVLAPGTAPLYLLSWVKNTCLR